MNEKIAKSPGRNDPYPSGSGKKYKHCSGDRFCRDFGIEK